MKTDDLFFKPIVAGYLSNPRFVRRDWLAEEIGHRLHKGGSRFVLMTAEPGAGKSTFMAQLAHDQPDCRGLFEGFTGKYPPQPSLLTG